MSSPQVRITPEAGITLGGIKVLLGIVGAMVSLGGAGGGFTLWMNGKFSDLGYRLTTIETKLSSLGEGHVEEAEFRLWVERLRRAPSLSEIPDF